MKTVSFQNDGLIDPRCITTIGVSVKEGENPIGFFGTGLKYAIAIILRHGGDVTIWRGLEPLRFTHTAAEIRGASFDIVCLNGSELGFTTELGKNWKMWQAMRELYCNTQDEGGVSKFEITAPKDGTTTIHVSSEEFAECFKNIGQYFKFGAPLMAGQIVNFHDQPSTSMFYRSVKVADHHFKFRFTPDFVEKIDLTEDRTIADMYSAVRVLAKSILMCADEGFIEDWLTSSKDYAEHIVDLDWALITPSEQFLSVANRIAADPSRTLNSTVRTVLRRYAPRPDWEAATLLPHEREALKAAIAFCHAIGYRVDEYPIKTVESLGSGILGLADPKGREIFLSRQALQAGDNTLAGTLIEEWAHIKHGHDDCSRPMQNFLLDSMVRLGRAYIFEHEKMEKESP